MKYGIVFFMLTCMVCIFSCSSGIEKQEVQVLKPWQSAGNKKVDKYYTTEYMTSREPRHVIKINTNWTFNYFPDENLSTDFISAKFDDSKWPAIAIPHTWQSYETTHQIHPFIMNASEEEKSFFGNIGGVGNVSYWHYGWGYYRKKFTLNNSKEGKRIFVEFEGVMKYCKVYLNGKYLGEHKGGFNAFYFDITDDIIPNKENILAVAVNNRLNDKFRIPPMHSGNQTHSGGIYRDVKVVIKNNVFIPFQGSYKHEGGTFVQTPKITKEYASVDVKTYVQNKSEEKVEVKLVTKIESPEKKIISTNSSKQFVKVGEIKEFSDYFRVIKNPQLWSPSSPILYKVISEVWVGDTLFDVYESPLGFRTFAWDYQENWGILNGERIHIHGTNRTQCFPWVNNAIPDWIDIMDIRDIKYGLSHNFIRPNLHANKPLIHDLFDRFGILVNLASPSIKSIDFSEEVQKQMAVEAVRRHRNHPSIVMYEVGNETNDGVDSRWIHDEDTTRIITARHVHGGAGDFVTHTDTNMDMENLLRCTVRGWTDEDVFAENPKNNQHTGNEEFQHAMAMVEGGSQRGRIDMHNGNMWMYSDDGAIRVYKNAPLNFVNPKGWVDVYRVPKYIYFLWQANYRKELMAFIHPHYWQTKYLGQKKDIIIDSNGDEVELFVNGTSFGVMYPNDQNFHTVVFKNIPIEKGKLKVKAAKGNEQLETILPMASKPAKLVLTSSHSETGASRDNIVMLTVDVQDKDGVQVQQFNKPLKWEITGPGKLIAPKLWITDTNKRNANSGVWYISTPVSNFVRAIGEEGTITVTVKSDGLQPAECTINVKRKKNPGDEFITQTLLSNVGREEVEWKTALQHQKDNKVKIYMKYVFEDIQLDKNKSLAEYETYFQTYILKDNPNLKDYPDVVLTVVTYFAKHVSKKHGLLVNDDYNFIVDNVNRYLKKLEEGKVVSCVDENGLIPEIAPKL